METPYEHQCNYIGDDGKEHSTSPSTLCFACGYEAALQLRPGLERKRVEELIAEGMEKDWPYSRIADAILNEAEK